MYLLVIVTRQIQLNNEYKYMRMYVCVCKEKNYITVDIHSELNDAVKSGF